MPRVPHDVAEQVAIAAVGIVLREAVKQSGMRQTDLAKLLEVSPSAVNQLLSGQSGNPKVRTLARLANALDMDLIIELRARDK